MSARQEKVREALDYNPADPFYGEVIAAALAEVEEWEAEADRLKAALTALVERVEMDESVGICLTSRVESLNALQLLAALAPADRVCMVCGKGPVTVSVCDRCCE